MSRFSNIRISKGGKLFVDEFKYNEETKSGKTDKGIDATSNILYHLYDVCALEDDVRLKDIFLLVKNVDFYPILSPIFTNGPWLEDLVLDGLSDKKYKSNINNISINWSTAISDDYYNEGKDILETTTDIYGKADGDPETYALGLTPLYELANCKIILNNEFIIHDERKETVDKRNKFLNSLSEEERKLETYYTTLIKTNKEYTLFDILYSLFWEFSFHGGPENRTKVCEDLNERIKNIDKEKLIPWEDVKKELEERIKNK